MVFDKYLTYFDWSGEIPFTHFALQNSNHHMYYTCTRMWFFETILINLLKVISWMNYVVLVFFSISIKAHTCSLFLAYHKCTYSLFMVEVRWPRIGRKTRLLTKTRAQGHSDRVCINANRGGPRLIGEYLVCPAFVWSRCQEMRIALGDHLTRTALASQASLPIRDHRCAAALFLF